VTLTSRRHAVWDILLGLKPAPPNKHRLGSERPENLVWESDCLGAGQDERHVGGGEEEEEKGCERRVKRLRLADVTVSVAALSSVQRSLVDGGEGGFRV
jgi:hypothetical protein